MLADGTPNIEALRAAGVNVKALFGPEHGVRGDVPAGKYVASYRDPKTGPTCCSAARRHCAAGPRPELT